MDGKTQTYNQYILFKIILITLKICVQDYFLSNKNILYIVLVFSRSIEYCFKTLKRAA